MTSHKDIPKKDIPTPFQKHPSDMKVYRFRVPYDDKGRANYREAKGRTGCYIIREDQKTVYVGYSGANLYKTLYRHFQTWHHPTQKVVSYASRLRRRAHAYTVRVIYCTDRQAQALEKRLIKRYHPRDNAQQYELALQSLTLEQARYMAQVEDIYFDTPAQTIDCPF